MVAIVDGCMEGEVRLEAARARTGVKIDAATLDMAAEDQRQRDARAARKDQGIVPALPLRRG